MDDSVTRLAAVFLGVALGFGLIIIGLLSGVLRVAH